jgi:HAD superfamily hydrolase (TIGR01509 family)
MIKAILFDSDGILVDTEQLFFEVTQKVFALSGAMLTRQQWARWYLGEGKRSQQIAEYLGIPSSLREEVIKKRDNQFWDRIAAEEAPILKGVQEVLESLCRQFRLAVVTGASRDHFERIHSSTALAEYFEIIVTSDDYQEPKPSPQAYLTALRKLNLNSHECIAVEDSPRGARSAISATIRCILVPTSLTDTALCPDGCLTIQDLTCLPELIRRIEL